MLCAGLTAYSPLVRNGCGPGKKVGIVGLGGIGHFGVMFAKALGAETWAISRYVDIAHLVSHELPKMRKILIQTYKQNPC